MSQRFSSLTEAIRNLKVQDSQTSQVEDIIDVLNKIKADYEKMSFRFERSTKEKNILSSLLTRTSIDLKKVSDSLKNRAEELTTLLNTIPAYVYFKDIHLNYIMVNQPFEEMIGQSSSAIQGKQLRDIIPGYSNFHYIDMERSVLESGQSVYNIEEILDYGNRTRWVSSNLAPIRNSKNLIIGLIGISWDITERKLHEDELRIAKEAAEAGTLAKNEFIASVSHEFRTPMNGILGLADILRNSPLTPEQNELLNGITSSARNLLVLLNDVLDFSAIEAGKMEMDYQPFMLSRIMEDIAIVTKIKTSEKSLGFGFTIVPDVPDYLVGDAQRLRQILLNLTNNAVKFTEKGKIEVIISAMEVSPTKAFLRFEVKDTGIGISEASLESLFRVFSRIRQDNTKLIAGTGLGLSICKKLTEMMGGQIGVESKPGVGSTFWFTLPFTLTNLPQKKQQPVQPDKESQFAGKRVLVAEDNLINQRIVQFQLKKMGFHIELASDGQEAYDKYLADNLWDVIILDIQMPKLDGYQVAKAIRMREQTTGNHVPILALTANAMKGDREIYLEAGMDGYVSKPFTFEMLVETLGELLKK